MNKFIMIVLSLFLSLNNSSEKENYLFEGYLSNESVLFINNNYYSTSYLLLNGDSYIFEVHAANILKVSCGNLLYNEFGKLELKDDSTYTNQNIKTYRMEQGRFLYMTLPDNFIEGMNFIYKDSSTIKMAGKFFTKDYYLVPHVERSLKDNERK